MSLVYEKIREDVDTNEQLPFKPSNLYKKFNLIDNVKDRLKDIILICKKDVKANTVVAGTIIDANAVLKGDLDAKDLAVIGSVKGDIVAVKLTIDCGAIIKGNISCQDVIIAGKVIGNINAKNKVEILVEGNVKGDITTNTIKVEDGAMVNGNIRASREGDINIGNYALDS